jgi:acyl-CoA reductase-like NAD-dependent aldehyde dehydrogenase
MSIDEYKAHYIDGEWSPSSSGEPLVATNPATGAPFATAPHGTVADVDRAVAAARRTFSDWAATPAVQRAQVLTAVADALESNADLLADVITSELGMPRKLARIIQVGLPLSSFRIAASVAELADEQETVGNSLVVREPVGVIAAITPWNYPIHQIAAKVAYAMAAGCTIVVKPSQLASISALTLAQIMDDADVPRGVVNVVTGEGRDVGEALVRHPDVDMVSFTGSTTAGSRVAQLAAQDVKRVSLELGGKSACVILDDADLPAAVKAGVMDCFLNSGQTCSALSRMLVPADRLAEAESIAASVASTYVLGDPFDPATRMGPVVSQSQQERVVGFVRRAVEEGARVVCGGPDVPSEPSLGSFVQPTVLSDVSPTMEVAREEVFGPVLAMIPVADEAEAIRVANDSAFGLSGAVWSADEDRALAVARQLRTGQVSINGGAFNPGAPFGGFKHSGYGREYGRHGLAEFLELKAIQR